MNLVAGGKGLAPSSDRIGSDPEAIAVAGKLAALFIVGNVVLNGRIADSWTLGHPYTQLQKDQTNV